MLVGELCGFVFDDVILYVLLEIGIDDCVVLYYVDDEICYVDDVFVVLVFEIVVVLLFDVFIDFVLWEDVVSVLVFVFDVLIENLIVELLVNIVGLEFVYLVFM